MFFFLMRMKSWQNIKIGICLKGWLMYQSIEQITQSSDFATQPKPVFVSIFIQYPWFYQVTWLTQKTNGFLVLRRGRFWSWVGWGGLVYSVARKMIELLVKVGHNDRWGEWCWPHSELQNSSWAEKLRWSKGKLALGWIFS